MSEGGEPAALVVMQSPAGPPLDTDLAAATLARHLPETAATAAVQTELAAAGFRVHPAVGISFSIEGPASLFLGYFGVLPIQGADGVWSAPGGAELPLDAMPAPERATVRAVVFEPRTDLMGGDA